MNDIPDPAALVLGQLAELRAIPEEDWTHGPLSERGFRIHRLRVLSKLIHDTIYAIEESLAADMERDTVEVPSLGRLRRSKVDSSWWKDKEAGERLREDLAQAVAQSVAVDIETGDLDQRKRNVALAAVRAAYDAIPSFSTLKVAGRKRFGIVLRDYRNFDERYKVEVEAIEDEEGR